MGATRACALWYDRNMRGEQDRGGPSAATAGAPLPWAPEVVRVARCAINDRAQADALALRALDAAATQNAAIRNLAAAVMSMPVAASAAAPPVPGDEHPDDARLDQFIRGLSPLDRLGLTLFLTMNVPRGGVDGWLGTDGLAERLAVIVDVAGSELGYLPADTPAECRPFRRNMIDVDDPAAGRRLRLHLLGCEHCVTALPGIKRTQKALRAWFERCETPLAAELPTADPGRSHARLPAILASPSSRRIAAVCTLVILVVGLLVARPARSSRPAASTTITAREILDRALNHHMARPAGVLHERFRIGTETGSLQGERWIDYRPPHALRLIVRAPDARAPLLDLATDGAYRLHYTARMGSLAPAGVTIEDEEVAAIQPLLRQLPAVGQLGSFPPLHRPGAHELLRNALRANPLLLGSATVLERPAYLLAFAQGSDQVVLTVDAETSALARATVVRGEGRSSSTVLWEAEQIELLAAAPSGTFDTGEGQTHDSLPNPRHLLLDPFSTLRLRDVARSYFRVPLPAERPAGTTLAYLRTVDFFGLVQAYEGEQASVAIVSSPPAYPVRPLTRLERQSGRTYWRVVEDDPDRQLTEIVFAPDDDLRRRSWLYVWHADLTDGERLAAAERIIDSITWVDDIEAAAYERRFVSPPAGGT